MIFSLHVVYASRRTICSIAFFLLIETLFVLYISGDWFTVNEKPPIAYVQLEIIGGANMKPSDLNGKFIRRLVVDGHSLFHSYSKVLTPL